MRLYGLNVGWVVLSLVVAYVIFLPQMWRYLVGGVPLAIVLGGVARWGLTVKLRWSEAFLQAGHRESARAISLEVLHA